MIVKRNWRLLSRCGLISLTLCQFGRVEVQPIEARTHSGGGLIECVLVAPLTLVTESRAVHVVDFGARLDIHELPAGLTMVNWNNPSGVRAAFLSANSPAEPEMEDDAAGAAVDAVDGDLISDAARGIEGNLARMTHARRAACHRRQTGNGPAGINSQGVAEIGARGVERHGARGRRR